MARLRAGATGLGAVLLGFIALACADHEAAASGGQAESDFSTGDPRWACAGHVRYPAAPAATLDIERRFYHGGADYGDPLDYAPFEGLTVDVCPADGDCKTPSGTAVTDTDGIARLTLPTEGDGFEGYLCVTGTDVVPLDLHMLPPISDANSIYLSDSWSPVAITTGALLGLARMTGVTAIDPRKGHVIATTLDCRGQFTPWVTVTANGAQPAMSTDSDNLFLNVEPGPVEIVGGLFDGVEIGHVTRRLAAGHILAVNFGPTP